MNGPLHLFEAFGIELEYMLVRRDSLYILPAVDHVFNAAAGSFVSDYEDGPVTWSNELVRHVMEVKVTTPVASLAGLAKTFNASLGKINHLAAGLDARLMPTAIHPWMNPDRETELWPHEYAEIYQTFHRVFNCHRHGWANLQSAHLNLPFCGDDEFARLHAAVRLVLPILPGLAASSPIVDDRVTGLMDNRLDVYVNNSRLIENITGEVIPEPVYSRNDYYEQIFTPMFKAIAPHDPEGLLQEEFLNARGAIARFDRGAIEIRLLDVQECPAADLAIAQAVIHAVCKLVESKTTPWSAQSIWPASRLRGILVDHIRDADETLIRDAGYLRVWNYPGTTATARDLWKHITSDIAFDDPALAAALHHIFTRGVLARRMVKRLPHKPNRPELESLYRELCDCLANGRLLT